MSHFTVGPLYKKIVKKHEEDLDAYNKKVQEESKELTNAIMNVGSTNDDGSVGGAGTGVLVATPAYKQWLATIQKRNPFIGKSYMQRADEYARDDEETTVAKAMSEEEMTKVLAMDEDGGLHISEDYDPNNAETVENEKLVGDAAKFSDLCVINNVVSKQLTWDFDSLMNEVTSALKDAHSDDLDFELPDNLDEQVEKALKHNEAIAALTYNKPQN